MPPDNFLTFESVTPAKACLVGSVMIGPSGSPLSQMTLPQLLASRSLKVVHRFGPVSPQLRSAMLNKSILPKVEINTPNGIVTLVNAQIVNIKPYVPHATPERSMPPSGFVAGVYAVKDGTVPKRRNPHELEEFDLVFNKITYTNVLGGKAAQDSWNIPG